jgi:hypothetical protein
MEKNVLISQGQRNVPVTFATNSPIHPNFVLTIPTVFALVLKILTVVKVLKIRSKKLCKTLYFLEKSDIAVESVFMNFYAKSGVVVK